MDKRTLRSLIRARKGEYTTEELLCLSREICARIERHGRVAEADEILLYHSLPDEVCTHELLDALVGKGKTVILPKVISCTAMTLHEYHAAEDLAVGAFGIKEPCTPAIPHPFHDARHPVALIPGMAFDAHGNRLGRGKGYYDRMLSMLPPIYKIGVCFPFQLLDHVPGDDNDIIMDEVISI